MEYAVCFIINVPFTTEFSLIQLLAQEQGYLDYGESTYQFYLNLYNMQLIGLSYLAKMDPGILINI